MIWKLIFYVAKFMKECKEDKINAYAAQTAFFIFVLKTQTKKDL